MKVWQSVSAVILTLAIALGGSTAAFAEAPVSFGRDPIVDTVGALSASETAAANAAIEQLRQSNGRQLFVAFVSDFTDPASSIDWADEVAASNNFGNEDFLLAVAVDGRAYDFNGLSTLSSDEMQTIMFDGIEPALSQDDWLGAIEAAAAGLAGEPLTSGGTSTDVDATADGGSGNSWVFFLVLLVIVAALAVFFIWRSRRKKKAEAEVSAASLVDLRRQAGSALVASDDAIRTSQEELGFAIASYGEDETGGFRSAIAEAKTIIGQAFEVQQALDDEVPDTEAQQREWYARILDLTAQADALLDAQADAFDELRALERNAPAEIDRVNRDIQSLDARLPAATTELDRLRALYAPSAVATIDDNVQQATDRLAFARQEIAEARTAFAAASTANAAVGIRGAEEATDQAGMLIDAVERAAHDLATADQSIAAAVADLRGDITTARSLTPTVEASAQLAAAVARTEAAIAQADAASASAARDPLAVLAALEAANADIDTQLQGIRDAQAAAARAAAELDRVMLSARSNVRAAEDFIVARRGAIGAEARTRLAEAGRSLSQAESLAVSTPQAALPHAQRAAELASQSIRYAQNDVSGYGASMGGTSGSNGNMMGAVLGGILINSVLGGGGRRSSGGMFGGGRGGFSGGGRSPGSFGGGATRARRGGGGRF